MKLLRNKVLLILLVLISGYGYIISCTHDDEIAPPPSSSTPIITRGNNVHLPGDGTTGDSTEWKFDKTHSSVLWSSNYNGAAGLLTGRFNQFGIHDVTAAKAIGYVTTSQPLKDTSWAFYESEPSKTYFNGYVQLNTSNTGEPGRDGGCYTGYVGAPKIISGTQNLIDTNLARIKTTKVEFDPLSTGYIVTFDFTFKGTLAQPLTKSLIGKLKYIPKSNVQFAPYNGVFGLQFTFQFNCREFGVTSTSVSDMIEVECNINFHNK